MIQVAFASSDRSHVDTHFGAAETFVLYDVSEDRAELLGIGEFDRRTMRGQYKDFAVPEHVASPSDPNYIGEPVVLEDPREREDKVTAKLEFLKDCAAVYAVAIGNSSVKRLMQAGIQPVIVRSGQEINGLLQEVATALHRGGVSWVERAAKKARARQDAGRFEAMGQGAWGEDGTTAQRA